MSRSAPRRRRAHSSSIYERLVVQRGRGGGIIGVSHKRGRPPIIAKGTRYAWRGLPGLRRRRRLVELPLLVLVAVLALVGFNRAPKLLFVDNRLLAPAQSERVGLLRASYRPYQPLPPVRALRKS